MSDACPGVRQKPIVSPGAFVRVWILVVKPPRERPILLRCILPSFGGVLIRSDDSAVDHLYRVVRGLALRKPR